MNLRAFTEAVAQLEAVKTAEDLFGPPSKKIGDSVKQTYRRLARAVHPDLVLGSHQAVAAAAFKRLNELKEEADTAIADGTYGNPAARTSTPVAAVIRSRRHTYAIERTWLSDGVTNLYLGRYDDDRAGVLRVPFTDSDNDLLRAEAEILQHLGTPDRPEAVGFFPFLPKLIDSFMFRENGTGPQYQANAFDAPLGFYTLTEVCRAYPQGVTPRHMAWMWRQLLHALGYAHSRGVVNGAILPPHILIHPSHDLMIFDWCSAVRDPHLKGGHIPVMAESFEDWYPPEVAAKQSPLAGTDILMSARCMVAVMGGNPVTGELPDVAGGEPVPRKLHGFLMSCLLPVQRQRPQDAWQLRREFTRLIEELWGPRKRLTFTM